MQPSQRPALASGIAAVLILVALVSPWWTFSFSAGGPSGTESSGPFDGDFIEGSEATTAGLLVLVGLAAATAAAILHALRPALGRIAALLSAGAALLVGLAAVLAVTTWPEGSGFWDSASSGRLEASVYAGFGWYTAVVATLVAGAAAFLGMQLPPTASAASAWPVASPPAPPAYATPMAMSEAKAAPAATAAAASAQCAATTKAGSRCARKAGASGYCSSHAA